LRETDAAKTAGRIKDDVRLVDHVTYWLINMRGDVMQILSLISWLSVAPELFEVKDAPKARRLRRRPLRGRP
jgi:hypothetical protein